MVFACICPGFQYVFQLGSCITDSFSHLLIYYIWDHNIIYIYTYTRLTSCKFLTLRSEWVADLLKI